MAEPAESKSPLTVDTECSHDFTVGPRFVDLRPVGYGATGLVFSATDSECDKNVAIKKLHFSDRGMCIQALREVRIMRRMEHENVLTVYEVLDSKGLPLDHVTPPNLESLRNMYIVQELMDTDLNQLIRSGQLLAEHTKLLFYQLLRGLKYIHSANVLHRDLKPNNLLINCEDLVLKIADFGVARIVDPKYNHKGFLTENVGSCWYRAPELILHPRDYSKAIDIWSCGCILAEMLLGRPLLPAAHELDLLRLVIDLIHLDDTGWDQVLSIMPNKMLKNHPLRARNPLAQLFSSVDPLALDLLEKLLVFDASERISAEEALSHPYFSEYFCPWDEPVAARPFHIESEVDNLSPTQVKKLILDENKGSHVTCGSRVPVECFCGAEDDELLDTSLSSTEETHTLEEIMNIPAHCEESLPPEGSGVESLNRRNLRNTRIADIEADFNSLRIENQDEEDENDGEEVTTSEMGRPQLCSEEAATPRSPSSEQGSIIQQSAKSKTEQGQQFKPVPSKPQQECDAESISEKDIDEGDAYQTGPCLEDVREIPSGFQAPVSLLDPPAAPPIQMATELAGARSTPGDIGLLHNSGLNIHSPDSDELSNEGDTANWQQSLCRQQRVDGLQAGCWCNHCDHVPVDAAKLQVALENCSQVHQANERIISTIPENDNSGPVEEADDENLKEKLVAEKSPTRKPHRRHKDSLKSRKRKTRQNVLTSSVFDEMYRLPTEHLGRDFSNERLKGRHVGKAHNNRLNEEINERLKEERQHGACGGIDLQQQNNADPNADTPWLQEQHSYFHFDRSTVLLNRHLENDLRNNRISSSTIEISAQNWSDSSHSPELPSSPRASNAGARPKRSPRKQKHKAV